MQPLREGKSYHDPQPAGRAKRNLNTTPSQPAREKKYIQPREEMLTRPQPAIMWALKSPICLQKPL